jgi:hypothetical protein
MTIISRVPRQIPILTAQAANGVGTAILVNDYKNIQIALTTSGSATATIRIQGSLQAPEDRPDFSAAPSPTNQWDYVAIWNYQDPTAIITGSTGIAVTGTDISRNLLVNTDGLVWLNVEVSGYAAGSVNATAVVYNNQ